MIVGPGVKTGLNIKSEMHNQLGADIVSAAVAAMHCYPSPQLVIDMGTATTMTVLIDSVCEGCVIIPGVHISLEGFLNGRPSCRTSPSRRRTPSSGATPSTPCARASCTATLP
jgi:pantothenate kinase type III